MPVLAGSLDLQFSRNIEQFLEILGLSVQPLELPLQFREGAFCLYLEPQQQRLLLTLSYESNAQSTARLLPLLLQRWLPERFQGVMQRIFTLNDTLFISCTSPEGSQASLWYQLYREQRQLLEQVLQELI
ncbi:MAG: hypothetical protein AB2989_06550 [Candidatus Symbiodolus clandestinus]